MARRGQQRSLVRIFQVLRMATARSPPPPRIPTPHRLDPSLSRFLVGGLATPNLASPERRMDHSTLPGPPDRHLGTGKRWREFLTFLKVLRRHWPDQKLCLICDKFSPHKHPEVRTWCAANRVDLVFLPTYASWLNWIQAEFAAVRYLALNGTAHRTHTEQDTAIGAYIRWRNQHARPKTGFAINSKIRHPDHPFMAA
ncbi:hypothetical protein MCAG_00908 [Micromonospora sp. ATCC 39149]|nr:hypothetical protein MCAG_00908 [Micromonospora sp. ATCC 39149]